MAPNQHPAEPPREPQPQSTLGLVLFGAAVVAVIVGAAALFLFFGDKGEATPASLDDLQRALGDVTLAAGTGVLDTFAPEVGKPAPDFALVDIADGTTVRKLSDFRGTPVVLNFFFRDCAPCKKEMPYFQEVYARHGGAVVFLGVDGVDTRSRAQSFLVGLGVTFPALLDTGAEVNEHYRLSGWPTTFFIDAGGVLRSVRIGQVPEKELAEHLAKIGVTEPAH